MIILVWWPLGSELSWCFWSNKCGGFLQISLQIFCTPSSTFTFLPPLLFHENSHLPLLWTSIHMSLIHNQNLWMATQHTHWALPLGLASERQQQDHQNVLPINVASEQKKCPFPYKVFLWLNHCLPIYWESQSHELACPG